MKTKLKQDIQKRRSYNPKGENSVDYRVLLKKYMEVIGIENSITFIYEAEEFPHNENISDTEIEALSKIANEIIEESR